MAAKGSNAPPPPPATAAAAAAHAPDGGGRSRALPLSDFGARVAWDGAAEGGANGRGGGGGAAGSAGGQRGASRGRRALGRAGCDADKGGGKGNRCVCVRARACAYVMCVRPDAHT